MTDLSYMYKCGKCGRNFATPDRLKDHEKSCGGTQPAEELIPMLRDRAANDFTEHHLEPETQTVSTVASRVSPLVSYPGLEPLKPE